MTIAAGVSTGVSTSSTSGVDSTGSTGGSESAEAVLELRDIRQTYGTGEAAVLALRGIDLVVTRGDYVAIMGPSGSGKSTLMNLLGCLDIASDGQYLLGGVDVSSLDDRALAKVRNQQIGFVFQSFNLIPRMSALANVELPLIYGGVKAGERKRLALEALNLVGLADRVDHRPQALSGGQQQRVAIARALVTSPTILLADEPTGNLDSQSTDDVLDILDSLSRAGRTVVVITHEDNVGAHAARVISIRDGQLVSDRRNRPLGGAGTGAGCRMTVFETIRSALRGVTSNKLRSALTLLGVMIGVAAVILLLAVGNGSSQQINSLITQLGTNTLTVRAGSGFGFGGGGGTATTAASDSTKKLTLDVANRLADSGLGHVKAVVPQVTTSLTVSSTTASEDSVSLIGTSPNYFTVTTAKIGSGAAFTSADVTSAAKVVVIGSTIASELFPTGSALGQSISVDGTPFTVVGILATQSSVGVSDPNSVVVAPISRVQRSYTGFGAISTMTVEATSSADVAAAQGEIEVVLDQLLDYNPNGTATAPYTVTDQTSLLQTAAASAQSFTVLLGAVAAISLLVGGIGVTNVMLVTVTERTREIGIRKALGATRPAILGQFLVEAATLTLLGGVLGVVVALFGAQFEINGTQPVVLGYSVPLALGVSVAIGVFFGVYPAARAAAMRPIQALRSI